MGGGVIGDVGERLSRLSGGRSFIWHMLNAVTGPGLSIRCEIRPVLLSVRRARVQRAPCGHCCGLGLRLTPFGSTVDEETAKERVESFSLRG